MQTAREDLSCLEPRPDQRYVRSFLFSRRTDAPLASIHLLARVSFVLCLSSALLRVIDTHQPDPVSAGILSTLALAMLLLSGANRRAMGLYGLLNIPTLFSLFLTWIVFYPVAGRLTLVSLPLYSGRLAISLAPWQGLIIFCIAVYFFWTRKIWWGLVSGCVLAFVQVHWFPLPELQFASVAFFHPLTLMVTDRGLFIALTKVIGYSGMILATLALIVTARDVELIGALRQLRVHHSVIFFFSTVFRSLDLALADFETIRQAQFARAAQARPRSLLRRIRDLVSIAIPMVAVMLRRSSEVGDALLARGYTLKTSPADFYETAPWRPLDWGVLALSLAMLYVAFGPHPDLTGILLQRFAGSGRLSIGVLVGL